MLYDAIITHFYPTDTPLRKILIRHSIQVRDKALAILELPDNYALDIDRNLVIDGAMVHDIGISLCDAPGILCEGTASYIAHGTLGAALIRKLPDSAFADQTAWTPAYREALARICERHTGAGLTREDILSQSLPIPAADYLPETLEEQLICLADKFFSKSGDMQEKPLERVRRSMMKFGSGSVARFEALCTQFHIK